MGYERIGGGALLSAPGASDHTAPTPLQERDIMAVSDHVDLDQFMAGLERRNPGMMSRGYDAVGQ